MPRFVVTISEPDTLQQGVVRVEASNEFAAQAHAMKQNPGWRVMGCSVEDDACPSQERHHRQSSTTRVNGPWLDGVCRAAKITMFVITIISIIGFLFGGYLFVSGVGGMINDDPDKLIRSFGQAFGFGFTLWGLTVMGVSFLLHSICWYLCQTTIATRQSAQYLRAMMQRD